MPPLNNMVKKTKNESTLWYLKLLRDIGYASIVVRITLAAVPTTVTKTDMP